MLFASSLISVEKSRVGLGMAGIPKKPDRCGVTHEIAALILTSIRRGREKRLRQIGRRLPTELRDELFPVSRWRAYPTPDVLFLAKAGGNA
jgi:hypothetical protein